MSVCDVVAAKPNIKTFLQYTWSGDILSSQQHMSSIISYIHWQYNMQKCKICLTKQMIEIFDSDNKHSTVVLKLFSYWSKTFMLFQQGWSNNNQHMYNNRNINSHTQWQQHCIHNILYTLTVQHAEMQNMFNQTNDWNLWLR